MCELLAGLANMHQHWNVGWSSEHDDCEQMIEVITDGGLPLGAYDKVRHAPTVSLPYGTGSAAKCRATNLFPTALFP